MIGLSVEKILKDKREPWQLTLVAGGAGLSNRVMKQDLHRPGMFLAGFKEFFPSKRLQLMGQTEISYLFSLDRTRRDRVLAEFFATGVPAVFVTRGLLPPEELIIQAENTKTPLVATSMNTTMFSHLLSDYLCFNLAASVSIHGTLVDVHGVGVLITGEAGAGKSECALSLLHRGHALIADDVVRVIQYPRGHLMGSFSGPEELRGYMEVRGVGMVDVASLFGITAVKDFKEIHLGIKLVPKNPESEISLNPDVSLEEITGVKLPVVRYPVIPGRDPSVIVEVLAINHWMRNRGMDSSEAFAARLKRLLQSKSS